jgi:hypothetical protein
MLTSFHLQGGLCRRIAVRSASAAYPTRLRLGLLREGLPAHIRFCASRGPAQPTYVKPVLKGRSRNINHPTASGRIGEGFLGVAAAGRAEGWSTLAHIPLRYILSFFALLVAPNESLCHLYLDDDGDQDMDSSDETGWKSEYNQWWFDFLDEKGGKGVSKDTWSMVRRSYCARREDWLIMYSLSSLFVRSTHGSRSTISKVRTDLANLSYTCLKIASSCMAVQHR